MKYKTLTILFLTAIFFVGLLNTRCSNTDPVCVTRDVPTEEILIDSAFLAFVDSVPIVRLTGFELNDDNAFEHVDLKSKFIPEGAALIGRFLPFKHHEFIIYSYPADIRLPVLEVYNSNGEKVNQHALFLYGTCPLDLEESHKVKLSKDFSKLYLETYCSTALSSRELDTIIIHELIPH